MRYITKEYYNAIPDNHRGAYPDYDGKHPEWRGRKCMFVPDGDNNDMALLVEGEHFLITREDAEYMQIAKKVKHIATTDKAGCYALRKLPRSATIQTIFDIAKAMEDGAWATVFESTLYNHDSADYCCILALVNEQLNTTK